MDFGTFQPELYRSSSVYSLVQSLRTKKRDHYRKHPGEEGLAAGPSFDAAQRIRQQKNGLLSDPRQRYNLQTH